MLDKLGKDVYIWYSPATDITGKNLATAMGTEHGSSKPKDKKKLIIGWGTKNKEAVSFDKGILVLNNPNAIKYNRDKFLMLDILHKAKVNVAPFSKSAEDIGRAGLALKLPVIGRKRFHQGGKGFWMCPTMTHVKSAIDEGAEYFQNMIEIQDEYRVHVFGETAIYVVKKVKRTIEEMEEVFVRQQLEKMEASATKAGEAFDDAAKAATMKILKVQAKGFANNGPNMLIRSNDLGWKFVKIKASSDNASMLAEAIKAVKAAKLDFGAVDCCISSDKKVYVIEINSGPGLEESTFNTYVTAFEEKIKALLTPATTASKSKISSTTKKNFLDRLSAAIDDVDEKDMTIVENVFKKMFG